MKPSYEFANIFDAQNILEITVKQRFLHSHSAFVVIYVKCDEGGDNIVHMRQEHLFVGHSINAAAKCSRYVVEVIHTLFLRTSNLQQKRR